MATFRFISYMLFSLSLSLNVSSCKETQKPTNSIILLSEKTQSANVKNVFGNPIESCCSDPLTGFYRDGYCLTGPDDYGTHIICANVTDAFLSYSKSLGNDLIAPIPERHFPGLKDGDKWCLCITRWLEAVEAGVTPPIDLTATHQAALDYATIELLMSHAQD